MTDKPHYLGHRQRLKSRFLEKGGDNLADYEMLELLLCIAIPRRDVKPLAKLLLEKFGSFSEVIAADNERLLEIKGIGESALIALKTVKESAVRLAKEEVMDKPVLSSWKSLLKYCRAAMAYNKIEQFRILFLDKKNVLIADEIQQEGTVDHTPVYPREVMKRALELGASAIIMVHNHPSGDPRPSNSDIEMTKEVQEAGEKLGITIHDHIIISKNDHASMKSMCLI